jgi:hypothetical protein
MESQVLLVIDESQRLKVAESFEFISSIADAIRKGDVQYVVQGSSHDVVSLNVRLRSELNLNTCVVPTNMLSEVFNDRASTQGTVISTSSGELARIDC